MMNGIIVIDKGSGFTSFDVVAIMRKLFSQKKVGHAGTLDPIATGVLPILLGSATKAQDMFKDERKEYIADFKLGIRTDTLDITGKVLEKSNVSANREIVESALDDFRGCIRQIPPMYSALKKDGKKLYELARQGITVERKEREVFIDELELLNFDEEKSVGSIRVFCSKGTYVRSLCDDLGRKIGCGAVMSGLRRIRACGFGIEESITIDEARCLFDAGKLSDRVFCVDKIFDYPKLRISEPQFRRFVNGCSLDICRIDIKEKFENEDLYRVYYNDKFLGLGMIEEDKLRTYKLFYR